MTITSATIQLAPEKAKVDANLDLIADALVQAAGEGADLALFPEAGVSGYFLEGGVLEVALTAPALEAKLWSRIKGRISQPIDVVVGFYLDDAETLYNAAAYMEFTPSRSKTVGVYRKFFLPTYGVFDEERFVARGRDVSVFQTRFGRVSILICEDVWHSIMPLLCAIRGANVLLVPAASPARGFGKDGIENHDRYKRLLRGISEEHGVFCLNAQLCGFEGGKGFIGGSMVIDPFGVIIGESPIAEPHILLTRMDLDQVALARSQSPLLSDLQSAWEDVRRLLCTPSDEQFER